MAMNRTVSRSQARGWQSVNKLRRKLRNMPEQVEKYIRPAVETAAAEMTLDMRGLTPVDRGVAATEIDYTVARDGLTARIGLIKQSSIRVAFYFKFLDGGTKGSPEHGLPPQPALHIRDRAFDANLPALQGDVKRGIQSALMEVARE